MPAQILLSLPPAMADSFERLEGRPAPRFVAGCDPPGSKLGSGGGTVHLLLEAWRRTGAGAGFREWIRASRKLIIHGGGQSRRLPAYAAVGKILAPMPTWRWATGQRIGQSLLDLQARTYERLLEAAPPGIAVMIAAGDVLVDFSQPAAVPDADVVGCGLWTSPEEASRFGVFFLDRGPAPRLEFFLQKPSPDRTADLSRDRLFLVDSGIWMLSERALDALFRCCGLDLDDPAGPVRSFDLYGDFAPALGSDPSRPLEALRGLSAEVLALDEPAFAHFGSTPELIASSLGLQNRVQDQRRLTARLPKPHPSIFVQNSRLEIRLSSANEELWIENAHIAKGWRLARRHAITGVPENDWELELEEGACLDVAPVGESAYCLRPYGFDDPFRGPVESARWLNEPAPAWFARRGLDPAACGVDPRADIQSAPLFPVVGAEGLDGPFARWLLSRDPADSAELRERWAKAERLSADGIGARAALARVYAQRRAFRLENLAAIAANRERSVFYSLDLRDFAREWSATRHPLPPAPGPGADPVEAVRLRMFRSEAARGRGEGGWEEEALEAYKTLRDAVVAGIGRCRPVRSVVEDQIVWSRAPVRADLAGGWTDTPPYCFLNGGRVVNVAIELNGQAPLQCFVRACPEPRIAIRSIDLGIEETVETYESLAAYEGRGSGFSIAKAALCLCGFHPRFGAEAKDLKAELRAFGGGFDMSLLSAVPKGSGLGTSSILAAVVLGALARLCGLPWDRQEIARRVLALEQMLGTGGGWQDQAGGLFAGMKLVESAPGFGQDLTVRWLPESFFSPERCESSVLLYYTGITRVANDILREIVRGMFLNAGEVLDLLRETGEAATGLFDAAQRGSWAGGCAEIARTWGLKQALDSGTNPPAIAAVIGRVADWLDAWTLPGAGGGGFLLMFAKDPAAAARVRAELESRPPNPRARFVALAPSRTGLQVTAS